MEIGSISHANLHIRATHEVPLVVLSVVIAVIASYTALDLAGRVTSDQGRVRKLWFTGGAMAMGIGIWSVKRDVTERQQAESALRQAEQKYRSIFEHQPPCIPRSNLGIGAGLMADGIFGTNRLRLVLVLDISSENI